MKRARSPREAMRRALESVVEEMHTGFMATVVSWAAGPPPTATVRPAAKNPRKGDDGTTSFEQLPDLPGCPVLYPAGGGLSLVWPLQAGDLVYVLVPDVSQAEVVGGATADGVAEPADPRRNNLTDAVILPLSGMLSEAQAVAEDALVVFGDDIRLGSAAATDAAAKAPAVATNHNDIASRLNAIITWLNACEAAGSFQTPAGPLTNYTPTDTAATKVTLE